MKAHLEEKRNSIRRQIVAVKWSSQVSALAFVRGVTEIEKRLESGIPISESYAIELWKKLQSLHQLSPYLPQSAIVLALKLAQLRGHVGKIKNQIWIYVTEFAQHYNDYLDRAHDKRALAELPRHFIDDVKKGLNIELLQMLVQNRSVSLIATLLSVLQVPPTAPTSLITDLISLHPELMTSKLAVHYTPSQVVLAVSKLLEKALAPPKASTKPNAKPKSEEEGEEKDLSNATLLSTLLLTVPTRHYDFEERDRLIYILHAHQAATGSNTVDILSRVFALIQPISLSSPTKFIEPVIAVSPNVAASASDIATQPGFTYALLARHFASTRQYSHLQSLLEAKNFNVDYASNEEVVALLLQLFDSHMRKFAFSILSHMPAARVEAIKEQTIFHWAQTTELAGTQLSSFIQEMSALLTQFNIKLPLNPDEIGTPSAAASKKSSPKSSKVDASPAPKSTSTATSTHQQPSKASKNPHHFDFDEFEGLDILEKVEREFAASTPSKPSETSATTLSTPTEAETLENEKQRKLLSLSSRVYDVPSSIEPLSSSSAAKYAASAIKKKEWTSADRLQYIEHFLAFDAQFGADTTLRLWGTYFMCLRHEISDEAGATPDANFVAEARRFENLFLERRPKLDDRDIPILGYALTNVGQYLWMCGKHSAAMSIANIMSYYKLRSNRDFEILVREQSSPQASVSGVSPLAWLRNVVKDSATADVSFFNALPGFLSASLKFNVEEVLAYSRAKAAHTGSASATSSETSISGRDFDQKWQVNESLEKHLARSSEIWEAIVPVWKRAQDVEWRPTGEFASNLLRLATIERAHPSFFMSALKYLQKHHVPISASDFPLVEVLEVTMKASSTQIGTYLLSSSGLNLLSSLPSNVTNNRPLTAFIMRCLASTPNGDLKNALLAYRLFSANYDPEEFSSHGQQILDAYYSVCASKKSFANAEKLMRGLLPFHASHTAPLYAMTIKLAGHTGDLSSAIRLYTEAQKTANEEWSSHLSQTVLHAVANCHVLPIEANRLRTKLEHPTIEVEEAKTETEKFLSSLSASELTRRSRSAYISL